MEAHRAALGDLLRLVEIGAGGGGNEVGEYSRDGQRWNEFFEMNLTKVK